MPPSSVHFNGSVNLPDSETVMREISSRVPRGLRRMTDGETGERRGWIGFQVRKFEAMPEFEQAGRREVYQTGGEPAPALPLLRLAQGVKPGDVRWPDLGYADAYAQSFQLFRTLQEAGTIPPGVRFQMQYPTPLAPIARTFVPAEIAALAVSYGSALFADLDRALETMSHDRCAVQWDVAVEFALLEGAWGQRVPVDRIASGLVQCADHVPADVPVGMHLCYGDAGHRHFRQPESLQMQVSVVNAVTAGAHRPLAWFSFTVPQDRDDEAYFAPLRQLRTAPETELYFSLVPYFPATQAPGTTAEQVRLIDAHLAESRAGNREWGVCTECGMGRVAEEDLRNLLDLHREILAASYPA